MLVTLALLSPLTAWPSAPLTVPRIVTGGRPAQSPTAPPDQMTAGLADLELALPESDLGARLEPVALAGAPTTRLGVDWPPWSADAWSAGQAWDAWAGAVLRGDDLARAQLAQLAHLQGRWDDAWEHLAAVEDSSYARSVLPLLVPGVPGETGPADGFGQSLPDGVLLRPALPPPGTDPIVGGRERRELELAGFRVGEAVLHMRVALEGDGVQIDVTHAGGGPCRLAIVIPEPQGFEIRVEYLDWERTTTVGEPHEFEIVPGDEPHKLWGRFLRYPRPWPGQLPPQVPAQVEQAGIVVVDAPNGDGAALLTGFATALERVLEVPVRWDVDQGSAARGSSAAPDFAPLRLHLGVADERLDKLAAMASLVERQRFGATLNGPRDG